MKSNGLILHGAIACLSLVVAYSAWKNGRSSEAATDEEGAEPQVVAADIELRQLKQITYEGDNRRVRIELAANENEPHWVTVTTKTKILQPTKSAPVALTDGADGGVAPDSGPTEAGVVGDGGPTPDGDAGTAVASAPTEPSTPEYRESTVRFVGNEVLDDLLKVIAPFKVVRRLGKLTPQQREEFGLVEPEGTIELTLAQGGQKTYTIGEQTYGGGNNYYVQDETGEGHLLGSQVVRDLKLAQSRLMQRSLHRFELDTVASVAITAGRSSKTLEHRHRDTPRDEGWVEAGASSETKNTTATNWMQQLGRLRISEYADASAVEAFERDKQDVMLVEYFDDRGRSMGTFELARGAGEPTTYWGRSEATKTWAQVNRSLAEQLASDIGAILNGSAAPAAAGE